MKYEKCETCGNIEFGKWGTLGIIGYSLIVGMLGYVTADLFFDRLLSVIVVIIGVILVLPLYYISSKEQLKEKRNNDTVKE